MAGVNWQDELMHDTEPYAFQRSRNTIHSNYPRAAQPNTSQPNAKPKITGWGSTTSDYWNNAFSDYMKRRG